MDMSRRERGVCQVFSLNWVEDGVIYRVSRGFLHIKSEMTVSYPNVKQMVGYANLEIRSNVRALEIQHSDYT